MKYEIQVQTGPTFEGHDNRFTGIRLGRVIPPGALYDVIQVPDQGPPHVMVHGAIYDDARRIRDALTVYGGK